MPHLRSRSWIVPVLLAVVGCGQDLGPVLPAEAVDLTRPWEAVAPAAVGVDPAALDRAVDRAAAIPRMRSLLVARSGRLVLERYFGGADRGTLFDVRSVTKSVVSTLTGLALARGDIPGLETRIGDVLPSNVATLRADQESMTVQHLLTMSGGFAWDEIRGTSYNDWRSSGDFLGFLLDPPMASPPGASFTYNSAGAHLLGVVLEEGSLRDLPSYADEHLFVPLGIEQRAWEDMGDGRVNGGAGIDLRGRDLARFGQLFLQDGMSGAERLLPEGWVAAATVSAYPWSSSFGPLSDIGYGYLWWIDRSHGAYLAWGYGGQFVYVVPSQALVVVATTEWRQVSQETGGSDALEATVLDIIVNEVLPGVEGG